MKARSVSATAVISVGVFTLAGCGGASSPEGSVGEYAKDGSFTTVINADPGNLHPLITNLTSTQIVNAYSYDSLIDIDAQTRTVRPYLAESWSEEGNTLKFVLKKGITCADGTSFTAQTAADDINWVMDPENASPLRGSTVPMSTSASADGDELTVTTAEPAPFLLSRVGALRLPCAATLEDPASIRSSSNGTGLFKVTEVVPNDHITMERRDGYTWSPNGETTSDTLGVPKTVTIKIVTDPSTTANLVLTGGVNAAAVTGSDEERVLAAGLDSKTYTTLSGEFIFNHFAALPTADRAVRQALVQAVDLDDYTEITTGGKGTRARALAVSEPLACDYNSVEGTIPEFDVDAAKKTLSDAGWKAGADGILTKDGRPLALNVIFNNSRDTNSAAAEYVATQWEGLGAKVKLTGGDYSFVIANTFSTTDLSSWDVSIGLTLGSDTPSIFAKYFTGPPKPEGVNFASLDNKKYIELSTQASLLPGDESCKVWEESERALFKDVDLLPVSTTPAHMFFNGATSIYPPSSGILPGSAIRVLK